MSARAPLLLLLGLLAASSALAADPVTTDPAPQDPPPSMASVRIPSGGVDLNGIVYLPGGPGPHPVAFVLHGLPGDERNLDLAQALRRAGWAVFFFHYRGAWGSPGAFSFTHVLEDVGAAVDWSLLEATRERFALDAAPRALVGHSMGGFSVLSAGADDAGVGCIASLAGANLSLVAAAVEDDDDARAQVVGAFDSYARGPLAGTSGDALVTELETHRDAWHLDRRVAGLAEHRVLLVAGSRDQVVSRVAHHDPLLAALENVGADVTSVVLDDDHAFSASRIALARAVTDWLDRGCP